MARTPTGKTAHHVPQHPLRSAAQPARKLTPAQVDLCDTLMERSNRIYRSACALDLLAGSLKDLGLTEFQVNAMHGLLAPIAECLTTDSLALADLSQHGVEAALDD